MSLRSRILTLGKALFHGRELDLQAWTRCLAA